MYNHPCSGSERCVCHTQQVSSHFEMPAVLSGVELSCSWGASYYAVGLLSKTTGHHAKLDTRAFGREGDPDTFAIEQHHTSQKSPCLRERKMALLEFRVSVARRCKGCVCRTLRYELGSITPAQEKRRLHPVFHAQHTSLAPSHQRKKRDGSIVPRSTHRIYPNSDHLAFLLRLAARPRAAAGSIGLGVQARVFDSNTPPLRGS